MLPLVLSANSQAGGYRIANSLRFRSSASAYLNRTFGTPTNNKIWTYSIWVKRGTLGAEQELLNANSNASQFYFSSTNTLNFYDATSGAAYYSTQVFRDPSSWYHILVSVDTTEATAGNRVRIYVNGSQVTAFSTGTAPTQNNASAFNIASTIHVIGRYNPAAINYFDGYLADVHFIDGQALTPSSFGETDALTGVWKPKAYSGTYGTNGFKLKFSDGTSTTTLGYDSSGNGNNWTTNNISLTAGSTYDWMIDSPTPYQGSSYGVGNYAVLNTLAGVTSGRTISNGNLAVATSASKATVPASIAISSGKWYWEVLCGATNNLSVYEFGIVATSVNIVESLDSMSGGSYCYYGYNGYKYGNTTGSAYGATFTNGDLIGVAFDADAGTLTFYKNNTSQGTAFTGLSGTFYPAFCSGSTGSNINFTANFGQRPFAYTPPSGYKSLCTYNLPTPTIQNGANYMAATLYTGNGSTQSIVNAVNGVSFAPDMVWVKNRSSSSNWHNICDIVRGVSTRLASNSTSAEAFFSGYATYAFNSNGFSVGDDTSGQYDVNGSVGGTYSGNAQYVGWQWKAGGTAVTNTAGSITSSVSANATAGFSVVTLTTQASGTGTFGHGLGIAPSMVITKLRSNTNNWYTYHSSVGATAYLELNTTIAATTNSTFWNNTAPTSSVVTLGSVWAISSNMVAYCFAAIPGYSAFGSYTGNGSTDGPFVHLGFRPRFVMIKRTDVADNWFLHDTTRDPANVSVNYLMPNLSNAEQNFAVLDMLSNGFKLRNVGGGGYNTSGATYIYACFAENPFALSLAR